MTCRVHHQKGIVGSEETENEVDIQNIILWIYFAHRITCACTHVDRGLHLHLLMLCAWGDMENYRERTLVASISSLVSEKCDLKGRRIKGDKLFSTTVNKRKL